MIITSNLNVRIHKRRNLFIKNGFNNQDYIISLDTKLSFLNIKVNYYLFLYTDNNIYNYYITNDLINKLSLQYDNCNNSIINNALGDFKCINNNELLENIIYINDHNKRISSYNSYSTKYKKENIAIIYSLFNMALFFNNEIRNI